MIPQYYQKQNWQEIARESFKSIDALADFLQWDPSLRKKIFGRKGFPFLLPKRLASKIAKNTWDDPILKQFLPVFEEGEDKAGFSEDPVQDIAFRKEDKLLQKYTGRALLITTSACAMHCRYCFRQNFPYQTESGFEKELETLREDTSLEEVILSGGDPLSLSNRRLKDLLFSIDEIPHIKRIRLHSRFPVGIPERIDEELLDIFKSLKKQLYLVVHINHKNECDKELFAALKLARVAGAVVLNQSVLLAGVNDDKKTLLDLSKTLVDNGILPYYIHQLDPVKGSSRFFVDEEKGKALVCSLSNDLSGYAVPRYVKEIPGRSSKTPV